MNVSFPLRDGYFRPVHATKDEEARWKQLVCGLVDLSLEEEKPYYASNYEYIDRRKWKFMRRKDQLRVYKPRRAAVTHRAIDQDAQCLLEVGTIEGTLEDVIYGVHHVTTHDMRATTSFLSRDALDSAILHVVENGSDADPYRSFALKWRILETPAGSLVKNRDVCVFEYMGIAHDDNGERYAFLICESFDHPVCPPFNPTCAIRAKTHTRIIYRQLSPGRVGMYYRGEYTTGGRIPTMIARWTAAEVAVSIRSSVDCAEAKKLTRLAVAAAATRETRHRQPVHKDDLISGVRRGCAICFIPTLKVMHTCQVCGAAVCNKCKSRKYLMSDEGKIQVACCKQCIIAAKALHVDPSKPLALISATYAKAHGVILAVDTSTHIRVDTVASSIDGCDDARGMSDDTATSVGDVYDILSGISFVSESTVTSMDSREDEHATVSLSDPMQSHRNGKSDALWRQMQELRAAAEHTYHLTKQLNKDWEFAQHSASDSPKRSSLLAGVPVESRLS